MTNHKIPVHAYQPDGLPNHRGVDGCAHCPLPRQHPVHDVPPVPADAAAMDARRLGEEVDS